MSSIVISRRKALVFAILATLMLLGFSMARAATSSPSIKITAEFESGAASSARVVGVASSSGPTDDVKRTFSFVAECSPRCSATPSWNFGDGSTASGVRVSHSFNKPGRYLVKATSKKVTDSIEVLVSTPFASEDLSVSDQEAFWTTAALGLLPVCRVALPATDDINPNSPAVNRPQPCPEPVADFGPTDTTAISGDPRNGVTGIACSEGVCGVEIPKDCNAACSEALVEDGILDDKGSLLYSPLNCLDGWVATQVDTSWRVVAGAEPGCVTRGELAEVLNQLVGTAANFDSQICADLGSQRAQAVARAVGAGFMTLPTRDDTRWCDAAAAATRAEFEAGLEAVTGKNCVVRTLCTNPNNALTRLELVNALVALNPKPVE